MNYVFFGTPRFAEIVLRRLLEANMPPAALVTNPDRPVGRKKIVTSPLTKELLANKSVKIFQPEKLDAMFVEQLRLLKPGFFVVAAYAKIIPKTVLEIPHLGTLGVHPSLLPQYRGASPIQSAILAGEKETGTTLYLMDEKMDHGPIVASDRLKMVSNTTYPALEEQLAELSASLLIKTIPDFVNEKVSPRTQDEALATYTKKFETQDGFVSESDLAAAENGDTAKATEILRKINALNPEPGCWTTKGGKRIKLLRAELKGGTLRLTQTQREGEKPRRLE